MKILHVTKKYPQALGGDAVVVANLQKQQMENGHIVLIVTSNCDEIKDGPSIYKCGLKDTPARLDTITTKRLLSLLLLCCKMFRILRKERPDVIHAHSVDMAFFVSFAARWYGIPLINSFHIVTFYDKNQSLLRRKSELWLAKKAKLRAATAPNKHDVKKLQAAGLRQTVLLPNGVDAALWEPHGYTEKNKKTTFVSFGRLEAQKGYEYLIKAAALLPSTHSLQIIIAGEGSQKIALQKLAQSLHMQDTVVFVGRKTPQQIRSLLSEAHAAVFPSLYETTPLTLLEAWAASMPVIASAVGILRDVPTGFAAALVVPPKDERALAAAMQQYLNDKSLGDVLAAAGRQEVAKYTWPRVANTVEDLYGSMQ